MSLNSFLIVAILHNCYYEFYRSKLNKELKNGEVKNRENIRAIRKPVAIKYTVQCWFSR